MIASWMRRHRTDLAAITFIVLLALVAVFTLRGETAAIGIVMLAAVVFLAKYDEISGRRQLTQYFVLFVWEDVEPQLKGPFDNAEERDAKARELRRTEGPDEGGIYWLSVDKSGALRIGPYTGGFLDDVDEADETHFRNYYRCPRCKAEWSDIWTATCDDDCGKCGKRHISPYKSAELKEMES